MSVEQIRSNKAIFLAALKIVDQQERLTFLDEACVGDAQRRFEVDKLLAADDAGGGSPLDQAIEQLGPADTQAGDAEASSLGFLSQRVGSQIGPYKVLEQIGDGGMGVVYVALQTEPVRRKVALKIIKPGIGTKEVVARFEAERQAIALMEHPHIARLIDAGTTDTGQPFFVMELVHGVPITQYCDEHQLTNPERLQLFIDVCRAVQHAHQKGVIHRDIKPSNVLVAAIDGAAVPKVIDFGVAKAVGLKLGDETFHTQFSEMVGTPLYMSPEQANMGVLDIDTRSDCYSLGVLLYELLTGATPFDRETLKQAGFDEFRRIIREDEPRRPSAMVSTLQAQALSTVAGARHCDPRKLGDSLRGELDWIVLKALEKDRDRRYESASTLAADIQRYLHGEEVQACPPSVAYRLSKFVHRNKSALTAAAAMAGVLILGTAISAGQASKARKQSALALQQKSIAEDNQREALNQRNGARRNQYYAEIVSGQSDWERGLLARLRGKLIGHLPTADHQDDRAWEWYYLLSLCHSERKSLKMPNGRDDVTWSPDGQWIGSLGSIWRADTGEKIRRFRSANILQKSGAWSPDSQMYAWGTANDDSCIYVWERTADTVRELRGQSENVESVAWSPDGRQLASRSSTVRIWDVATWSVTETGINGKIKWSPDSDLLAVFGETGLKIWKSSVGEFVWESSDIKANSVSWHPDGSQLAASTSRGWCILSSTDWTLVRQPDQATGRYTGDIAWRPDGEEIAVAGGNVVSLWKPSGSEPTRVLQGHSGRLAWRPDGEEIAVAGGNVVSLWKPSGSEPTRVLQGHLRPVGHLAWSPDGQQLATSDVETIKLWDLQTTVQPPVIVVGESIRELAWLDDGATISAIRSSDGSKLGWNVSDGQPLSVESPNAGSLARWSPDRRHVAQIVENETGPRIQILDPSTSLIRSTWRGKPDDRVLRFAWSSDGSKLAIRRDSADKFVVELWDVDTERKISQWLWNGASRSVSGILRWSDDDSCLAVAAIGERGDLGGEKQGHVYVVDVDSGGTKLKHELGSWLTRSRVTSIAWSPDGQRLVAGNTNGLVEVIDVDQSQALVSMRLHDSSVRSLDWSPDGRRIVSGAADGSVKILTADDGKDLLSFKLDAALTQVLWSPSGQVLVAATETGNIHLWDASRGYEFSETGRRRSELAWDYYTSANKSERDNRRREFLRLAPDSLEFWEARGHAWAGFGDFQRAGEEFAKEFRSGVRRSYLAAKLYGFALLGDGRREAFARHRQSILEACPHTGSPSFGGDLVLLCLLTECDDLGSKEAIRLAQTDVNENRDRRAVSILGAALFRDGQYQAAAGLLKDSLLRFTSSSDSRSQFLRAVTLYFLAMSRHQLGHAFQASRYVDEAAMRFESSSQLTWYHRVQLKVLKEEAKALLGMAEN